MYLSTVHCRALAGNVSNFRRTVSYSGSTQSLFHCALGNVQYTIHTLYFTHCTELTVYSTHCRLSIPSVLATRDSLVKQQGAGSREQGAGSREQGAGKYICWQGAGASHSHHCTHSASLGGIGLGNSVGSRVGPSQILNQCNGAITKKIFRI